MFRTYQYYSINQIFINGLNYHVIHYQTIDSSNVYLILCETLCLLCVFCGYLQRFRFLPQRSQRDSQRPRRLYVLVF